MKMNLFLKSIIIVLLSFLSQSTAAGGQSSAVRGTLRNSLTSGTSGARTIRSQHKNRLNQDGQGNVIGREVGGGTLKSLRGRNINGSDGKAARKAARAARKAARKAARRHRRHVAKRQRQNVPRRHIQGGNGQGIQRKHGVTVRRSTGHP